MAREVDLGSVIGPKGADGATIIWATTDLQTGAAAPEGAKTGDVVIDSKYDVYQVNAEGNLDLKGNIKGADGSAGATTADGVSYGDKTVKDVLDDLLYTAINITSFTVDPVSAEVGSTVNTVVLKWDYNKTPASLTLDGAELDVTLKTKTIENAGLKASKKYTLVATDERGSKSTKEANLYFLRTIYWGVGAAEGGDVTVDSAFVLTLPGKTLTSTKARTITVNAGEGQYIYYAIPTSFGTPKFVVGGFEGGFDKVKTFQHTNASGYVESYDVWRSAKPNLGDTTVVIS